MTDVERIKRGEFYKHLVRHGRFLQKAGRQLARTAYHEAGHVVAFIVRGILFDWVAVQPLKPECNWVEDDDDFHEFAYGMVGSSETHTYTQLDLPYIWHDLLLSTLTGPAAEARYLGWSRFRLTGRDRRQVAQLVAASRLGDRQIEKDYRTLASHFVIEHHARIEAVALALIERRLLTYREVRRIVRSVAGP